MPRHGVYHSLVAAFQAEVIRRALAAAGGNRTHAARLLGLQRTYLLRLMRDRAIDIPRSPQKRRHCAPATAVSPAFHIEITGWEPLAPSSDDDGHAVIVSAAPAPLAECDQAAFGSSSSDSCRPASCLSSSNRGR